MIEIDCYIDDYWAHYELDKSLKISKVGDNTKNTKEAIECVVKAFNSPRNENSYWFEIEYDPNKKLWECKRVVDFYDFYDNSRVTLSVYQNDYFEALKENENIFRRLQQIYNPKNARFKGDDE